MQKFALSLAILLVVCLSQQLVAQTTTDRLQKKGAPSVSGTFTSSTKDEVIITRGSTEQKVATPDIVLINFAGEPRDLNLGRRKALNREYKEAKDALDKVTLADASRTEVQEEIAFYKALTNARLALMGVGDLKQAGGAMFNFVNKNPNSYHYYEGCEVVGDLFLATKNYDQAEAFYNRLAAAPFDTYKLRAGILVAQANQAKGDHQAAISKFNDVLQMASRSTDAKEEKLAAELGKAISLAGLDKVDDAVEMVERVIQNAEPEAAELHAKAYNALGNCYLQAGQSKAALLAFLHVDVLYNNFPEKHAEALYHLKSLWVKEGNEGRSRSAAATLSERYPTSSWAKKK